MIDTIKLERSRYLDFFHQGIDHLKRDKIQFEIELLIETGGDELQRPFNLLRVDFIFKDSENIDRINALQLDSHLDYKAIKKTINNTEIDINPFCWDNCKIIADKIDLSKLTLWIEKWIDIDGSRQTDFSNSIHNCSIVQKTNEKDEIIIDFGTAPIDALLDLIDLIKDENKKIEIK